MIIHIRLEGHQLRDWLKHLVRAIHTMGDHSIYLDIAPRSQKRTGLQTLLTLEKMIVLHNRENGCERRTPRELGLEVASNSNPNLVLDLTSHPFVPNDKTRVLAPSYDGARGEPVLAGLLLSSGAPLIGIDDLTNHKTIATGTPSLEAAEGLSGSLEAVYSRLIILLKRILKGLENETTIGPFQDFTPLSTLSHSKHLAKSFAHYIIREIYRLCYYSGHWRVGYRFIDGNGVLENKNLTGTPWKIIDHPYDHFYADPFLFNHEGRDYLFFELFDHHVGKGTLAVIRFDENGNPGPAEPVLEEPWHLSYPFIFSWQGDIWMIPESSNNNDVAVYRATNFPLKWERHETLLSGLEAADATIIEYQGAWWMFAVEREGLGGYSDTLCLYKADNPLGPWVPHPQNPVLIDHKTARSAGKMVIKNDKLWRPVQDCERGYGSAIGLAEVTQLDDEGFAQHINTVIHSGGPEWPGRKIHTRNRVGRLEVIDGSVYRPRIQAIGKFIEKANTPR